MKYKACYAVGGDMSKGWNFTYSDPTKPARGVVLTYYGGSNAYCPGWSPNPAYSRPTNRSFSVDIQCAPGSISDYGAAYVYETNSCDYRIQLRSVAGCPSVCQTGATVCNGKGICGYDTDNKVSACFCNSGFSGAQCGASAAAPPKGLTSEAIILIVVCIMLLGVLAGVGYMFIKLRNLQVDPSAYGQLEGKYNELGMLA
jgi:hypothetical protein